MPASGTIFFQWAALGTIDLRTGVELAFPEAFSSSSLNPSVSAWLSEFPEPAHNDAIQLELWREWMRRAPLKAMKRVDSNDQWGTWFERAVPQARRLARGQFFTPAPVCDLLLGLTVESPTDRVFDPACGTGAFLVRARHLLRALGSLSQRDCTRQLWGVELDARAAALCAFQLFDSPSGQPMPHIWPGDFLTALPDGYEGFDVVVGNPPYVRQERHSQNSLGGKSTVIECLAQTYRPYLEAFPEQKTLFRGTGDLYLWFFLKATLLLKPGGRLAFVTSNSWLNTAYGKSFQQFLSHHFDILTLLEPSRECWFPDAAINPVVTVLCRKDTGAFTRKAFDTASDHPVRLIRLNAPLRSLLPDPVRRDYWDALRHVLQTEFATGSERVDVRSLSQRDLFRPEPWHSNWAFALRSPNALGRVFEASENWTTLERLGAVRYPLKTGINQFFYLTADTARQFGIEPEFLLPVVKSTKSVRTWRVTPEDLSLFLFSCPFTLQELAERGKTGAIAYIRWGMAQVAPPRQKRPSPVPWPEVPSVRGRAAWHQLPSLPPADLLAVRFVDRRFFFALCEGSVVEDQTFYGVTLRPDLRGARMTVAALLNATLSYFMLEFSGRTNLGDGALQFSRHDMATLPILNPERFSQPQRQAMAEAFASLLSRKILPIEAELSQPDRRALDEAVLSALGLRDSGLREDLYEALLQRVEERVGAGRRRRESKLG